MPSFRSFSTAPSSMATSPSSSGITVHGNTRKSTKRATAARPFWLVLVATVSQACWMVSLIGTKATAIDLFCREGVPADIFHGCCSAGCSRCGGFGCIRAGSSDDDVCCIGQIPKDHFCSAHDAPCMMDPNMKGQVPDQDELDLAFSYATGGFGASSDVEAGVAEWGQCDDPIVASHVDSYPLVYEVQFMEDAWNSVDAVEIRGVEPVGGFDPFALSGYNVNPVATVYVCGGAYENDQLQEENPTHGCVACSGGRHKTDDNSWIQFCDSELSGTHLRIVWDSVSGGQTSFCRIRAFGGESTAPPTASQYPSSTPSSSQYPSSTPSSSQYPSSTPSSSQYPSSTPSSSQYPSSAPSSTPSVSMEPSANIFSQLEVLETTLLARIEALQSEIRRLRSEVRSMVISGNRFVSDGTSAISFYKAVNDGRITGFDVLLSENGP